MANFIQCICLDSYIIKGYNYSVDIRELQNKAKNLEKVSPRESCQLYEQAISLDVNNPFSISGYGRALRQAKETMTFVEFCDAHANKEIILKDSYVNSIYCWCLYDSYFRSTAEISDFSLSEILERAQYIVNNNKQLENDEAYKTPYVFTVLKVVKILDAQENSFDEQLRWLAYINPEILPTTQKAANADDTDNIVSLRDRFYYCRAWVLYKKIIRLYDVADSSAFDEFMNAAEIITSTCSQLEAGNQGNPYVPTVLKVLKILNGRDNKNYSKILVWVQKLDPNILSEDVFTFTDETGKDRELASPLERYYQYLSKAYEKLKKYDECVKVCDLGLQRIKYWHNRNHIWVRARREYCNCYLSNNFENDIKNYQRLAEREKHWFMFHKIALLYYSRGYFDEAMLFAAKALGCGKIDTDTMINLLYDTGLFLQALHKQAEAHCFFQACAYYRKRNGWSIQEELRFIIDETDMDTTQQPNLGHLKSIASSYIKSNPNMAVGFIKKILQYKDGFITCNGTDYYFSSRENKHFNIGQQVQFQMDKDTKGRPIAINIQGVN